MNGRAIDDLPRLSPSQMEHLAWQGTPVSGSKYTEEQHEVMKAERPNWSYFRNVEIKLGPADASALTNPDQFTVAHCPVIAWTNEKNRWLIITPGGDKKWIKGEFSE
ncbi:MAG: hypothetical protein ABJP02_05050 [Parasphingorhabdus sp.]|uniref:hypothetical protein n=1 Tax=Parasphingorhabdus sp. TaxID=2709688 RepID=UPI003299A10B